MMFTFERAVLMAAREHLRANLHIREQQCDLEVGDDIVPATAEQDYFAVIPAGLGGGRHQRQSGTVWDVQCSIKVTLFSRTAHIPRDRRRSSVFDAISETMTSKLSELIHLFDRNQTFRSLVQTRLTGTEAENGRVVEPFRLSVPDRLPRVVLSDAYQAAAGSPQADPIVSIARGIIFQDIRFMQGM